MIQNERRKAVVVLVDFQQLSNIITIESPFEHPE